LVHGWKLSMQLGSWIFAVFKSFHSIHRFERHVWEQQSALSEQGWKLPLQLGSLPVVVFGFHPIQRLPIHAWEQQSALLVQGWKLSMQWRSFFDNGKKTSSHFITERRIIRTEISFKFIIFNLNFRKN